MFPVSFSTLPRLVASAAVAGVLSMQPVSSFAQTAPTTCAQPVLDLANPAPGEMLLPGAYTIQGAALDPAAAQGSGIDRVSFFLGDRNAGGMALGTAQPDLGPRLDDFSVTVTLPSTRIGEQQFVAYAHSAETGKETQVSFPIVLGEDPSKTPLTAPVETTSSTVSGAVPSMCETVSPKATPAPAPVAVVAVPVAVPGAMLAQAGIVAAQAYAESVQTQAPVQDVPNGESQNNNNDNFTP